MLKKQGDDPGVWCKTHALEKPSRSWFLKGVREEGGQNECGHGRQYNRSINTLMEEDSANVCARTGSEGSGDTYFTQQLDAWRAASGNSLRSRLLVRSFFRVVFQDQHGVSYASLAGFLTPSSQPSTTLLHQLTCVPSAKPFSGFACD